MGDGSVCSSDSPKAKTAKNESTLPVPDISDMGIGSLTAVVNQQHQGQSTGKEHCTCSIESCCAFTSILLKM